MHPGLARHIMDEGHAVGHPSQGRDRLSQHLAGVTIGLEWPDGGQPGAQTILKSLHFLAEVGGLAVPLHQFRFEIEQVDMTGRPRHEELHHSFGLGWKHGTRHAP